MNREEARAVSSPEIRRATAVEQHEGEIIEALAELERIGRDFEQLAIDAAPLNARSLALCERRAVANKRLNEANNQLLGALSRRGRS